MDCARRAQIQSHIRSYSLQGMVKAPVGGRRPNIFAVADQFDSDLDNVAMSKYGMKVGELLNCAASF